MNAPPDRRGITRRTALAGAAAAGAASMVSPAVGLAELLDQQRGSIFSRWIGTLEHESGALAAPRRFALTAVQWAGPVAARIELRTRARGRGPSHA